MKKMFRYARWKVCRAIVHWDDCPVDNRKNWGNAIMNVCAAIGLSISFITIMSIVFLYS